MLFSIINAFALSLLLTVSITLLYKGLSIFFDISLRTFMVSAIKILLSLSTIPMAIYSVKIWQMIGYYSEINSIGCGLVYLVIVSVVYVLTDMFSKSQTI